MTAPLVIWLFMWQGGATFESASQLVAAGKFEEAKQMLATMEDREPGVTHLRGLVAYNLRDYPAAIAELSKAVQTEPAGTKAHVESALLLGQSYYLQARAADAIPWLEQAREGAGPKRHEVEYMLGNCYIQSRQPEKAQGAFASMFGVALNSAPAHLLTAQMMIRQEFEEPAEKELREALRLDPRIAGAHLLLGELATYHARIDDAVKELQQEIALNPASATAYYKLGDAYSRREQWPDAIPQLERAIWLNPNYSGPYIILGKAYFKTRQLSNAEGILRRAIQMDPQNTSAMYLLGQTLTAQGRTEQGKQMLLQSQQQRKEAAQ